MPAVDLRPFVTTRNGVPYFEMVNLRESYKADQQLEATRICVVDWDNIDRFIEDMLPDVSVSSENVFLGTFTIGAYVNNALEGIGPIPTTDPPPYSVIRKKFIRKDPEEHPRRSKLYAAQAEVIEGLGWPGRSSGTGGPMGVFSSRPVQFDEDTQIALDGAVKIAVTYRTLPYTVGVSDALVNVPENSELSRYVSIQSGSGVDSVQLPLRQLHYATNSDGTDGVDGGLVTTTLNKVHFKTTFTMTWHMVPVVPSAAADMTGLVNQTELPGNRLHPRTYKVGSLLYVGYEVSKVFFTPTRREVRDITYHFTERRPGWNFVFRPDINYFVRIYWPGANPFRRHPPPVGRFDLVSGGYNLNDFGELKNLFRIDEYAAAVA